MKSLPDAEQARNVILGDAVIKKIVAAAYKQSVQFGRLVEIAAVTGARYSQITGLLVGDLQDASGSPRLLMPSSKKGRGAKKVVRRPVPIPAALAKRLHDGALDRQDGAPLLLKPPRPQTNEEKKVGSPSPLPGPWRKSDHIRPFKRAVAAAFKPAGGQDRQAGDQAVEGDADAGEITIYALRHSSIVRQILAGVPIRVVAVMHDTSVLMIEKNYSKQLADHTDAIARAALLDIDAEGEK